MNPLRSKCPAFFGISIVALGLALAAGGAGCGRQAASPARPMSRAHPAADGLAWVLAPHDGEGRLDVEIRHGQALLRAGTHPELAFERLGWLFVAKARESFDSGYYRLAEHCARGLEARRPGAAEALLLRGHVLQNQHRFREAEAIARELVGKRGRPFDYGLLGDALMEQGDLRGATAAYQAMLDLRPDLHSYARGAHIRWLKGDLEGAVELAHLAASASSPLEAESAAWIHTRLAFYQWQTGAIDEADQVCQRALEFQTDYPPALFLRGRIRLASGETSEAVAALTLATRRNPVPEYQWALVEALRQQGEADRAAAVESQLRGSGAAGDPRTYALYLAGSLPGDPRAVSLAEQELQDRSDVFTHDALAWSLAAAGRIDEAQGQMEKALAEGTRDGRLFFHAAVIARRAGEMEKARHWFDTAVDYFHLLLPSEQEQLLAAAPAPDPEGADSPEHALGVPAADDSTGTDE